MAKSCIQTITIYIQARMDVNFLFKLLVLPVLLCLLGILLLLWLVLLIQLIIQLMLLQLLL